MALKSIVEAALYLGLRVETIESMVNRCPKPGLTRTLKSVDTAVGPMFDEEELSSFVAFLNEPWPLPKKGDRPAIPKIFRDDVKEESHHMCAICGFMDNGEIAHIDAVSSSLNNAPGNLIYLCPNHHTKYDLGFKPSSNVTIEEVISAKKLKRNSRCRVLKYEANATRLLQSLIGFLRNIEATLKTPQPENIVSIYLTEMRGLMASIPDLTEKSYQEAKKDLLTTRPEKELAKIAPKLAGVASSVRSTQSDAEIRSKAKTLVSQAEKVIIDIDEVDCPHCGGRGQTGLVGDFCAYCRGSCVVSEAKRDAYDVDDIDEVECPHCSGRGTTGLVSDICTYCHGSQVVSEAKRDAYDVDDIDEVECPHCNGRGTTGLSGDICTYCRGSQVVSHAKLKAYDPDDIDEVECPHCNGKGTTGLAQDMCALCKGSCVVTAAKREAYAHRHKR